MEFILPLIFICLTRASRPVPGQGFIGGLSLTCTNIFKWSNLVNIKSPGIPVVGLLPESIFVPVEYDNPPMRASVSPTDAQINDFLYGWTAEQFDKFFHDLDQAVNDYEDDYERNYEYS